MIYESTQTLISYSTGICGGIGWHALPEDILMQH